MYLLTTRASRKIREFHTKKALLKFARPRAARAGKALDVFYLDPRDLAAGWCYTATIHPDGEVEGV
jgi:hypothetical protein